MNCWWMASGPFSIAYTPLSFIVDEGFSLKDWIQEDVDDERGNIFFKTINKQKMFELTSVAKVLRQNVYSFFSHLNVTGENQN